MNAVMPFQIAPAFDAVVSSGLHVSSPRGASGFGARHSNNG
jgi:hypothetical protein